MTQPTIAAAQQRPNHIELGQPELARLRGRGGHIELRLQH